jgi:2,3-bisphosphoglycerate-dependent phosphoglycerate mutase
MWQKALNFLPKKAKGKPGALILLRCGESTWNANQTFTGWADPDLTAAGYQECEHAARLLLAQGYSPDVVYTSRLKRAVRSAWTVLAEMDSQYLPVYKSWRLNERSYGALTGLSKKETAKQLGADVVQAWRNSLKARPPPMKKTDPYYPGNDPRYADIDVEDIPLTESLLDCQERARPLWEYKIKKDIENGENVLVVGHTNTLRGLIKQIDGINDDDIQDVSMPNGVPFVYRFDKEMNPTKPGEDSLTQVHASGTFLEKPGLLKKALKRQEDWAKLVPGFDTSEVDTGAKRVTTLENSLLKLRNELTVEAMVDEAASESDDGAEEFSETDGNLKIMNGKATLSTSQDYEKWEDDPCEFEEFDFFASSVEDNQPIPLTVVPLPDDAESKKQEDAVVVLIRHGRTPHNNLGLFTGT